MWSMVPTGLAVLLTAWVKLKEGALATEEEIRAYCRGQIATYKIPRYVLFVDAFPMTVTGKIQKFILREWAREKLPHLYDTTVQTA